MLMKEIFLTPHSELSLTVVVYRSIENRESYFDWPLSGHTILPSRMARWEKGRLPPQQSRESQQRPGWWRVEGFSGSTIHPIPAQPTKSVATWILWTCTSRRASDANCRTIYLTK